MIKRVEVTRSFIESQKDFLEEVQKAVSNGVKAPLGIITDNTPEIVLRTKAIVSAIMDKYPTSVTTLVVPGIVIQMLFPEKETLISVIFSVNPVTNDRHIHLEVCKLSSEVFSYGN